MTADQVFILAFLLFVILNEVKDLAWIVQIPRRCALGMTIVVSVQRDLLHRPRDTLAE
jgi:hypothetical protein